MNIYSLPDYYLKIAALNLRIQNNDMNCRFLKNWIKKDLKIIFLVQKELDLVDMSPHKLKTL